MVGRTKQYVEFEPQEEPIYADVSELDVQEALEDATFGEYINVYEVEFIPSEVGNVYPTVTVIFTIDRSEFEQWGMMGYNELSDSMNDIIVDVIGGEFEGALTEGGW